MKWPVIVYCIAIVIVSLSALFIPSTAGAGIGPNGFATYARQGIVNINNRVYGKNNSPWRVKCTDKPNYRALTDTVTCKVTPK